MYKYNPYDSKFPPGIRDVTNTGNKDENKCTRKHKNRLIWLLQKRLEYKVVVHKRTYTKGDRYTAEVVIINTYGVDLVL